MRCDGDYVVWRIYLWGRDNKSKHECVYSEIKWNIPTLVDFNAVYAFITKLNTPNSRYSKSKYSLSLNSPFDRRTILKRHRLFVACALSLSLLFIWAQNLSVFSRTFIRSGLSLLFYFSTQISMSSFPSQGSDPSLFSTI